MNEYEKRKRRNASMKEANETILEKHCGLKLNWKLANSCEERDERNERSASNEESERKGWAIETKGRATAVIM